MIRAESLSKSYGNHALLSEVSLALEPGARVGVVGESGSGRSTLLRVLATLTPPSAGRLVIDGIDAIADPFRARTRVFHAGDATTDAGRLSALDYLRWIVGARRARCTERRLHELLEAARIDTATPPRESSSTARVRTYLAAGIASGARLLLADDALDGAEPAHQQACMALLDEARAAGASVILTGASAIGWNALDRTYTLRGARLSAS